MSKCNSPLEALNQHYNIDSMIEGKNPVQLSLSPPKERDGEKTVCRFEISYKKPLIWKAEGESVLNTVDKNEIVKFNHDGRVLLLDSGELKISDNTRSGLPFGGNFSSTKPF